MRRREPRRDARTPSLSGTRAPGDGRRRHPLLGDGPPSRPPARGPARLPQRPRRPRAGARNSPKRRSCATTARTWRSSSRWSEAVVLHAHVSNLYFESADPRAPRPLVVDLYDPFPIENLNYFPTLGDGTYRHDRATLERQLREGDLFLCSSPEQRLFYLGMLYALGRLNPETYFADFTLANLVREVPFGIAPPEPAAVDGVAAPAPLLRGVVPGIGADDPILFFGGIYDWYDPMLLLAILPALMARFPTLRVVFSANPNAASTPQGTYAEVARRGARGRLARPPRLLRALGRGGEALRALPRGDGRGGPPPAALRGRDLAAHARPRLPRRRLARRRDRRRHDEPAARGGEDGLGGARGRRGGAHRGARRAARFGAAAQRARRARARLGGAAQSWDTVLAPLVAFLDAPRIDPHKQRYPAALDSAVAPRRSLRHGGPGRSAVAG